MKHIVFFLFIANFCFAQKVIRDTSFLTIQDHQVLDVSIKWYEDGRRVEEQAPVKDKRAMDFIEVQFERAAIGHYTTVAKALETKEVMSALDSESKEYLNRLAFSVVDTLSRKICTKFGDPAKLDGEWASVQGTKLVCGDRRYTIKAFCIPWIRIYNQEEMVDFFWDPKQGLYVSLSGRTLQFNVKKNKE